MEDSADTAPPRGTIQRVRRALGSGPLRTLLGVAVLAAIVGGLLWLDRESGSNSIAAGPLDDRSPRVGELAPDFELEDSDGNLVRLSDYRGTPVWLNFWATWCGPCRRELPDIEVLANEFGAGMVVLAINQEESAGKAEDFWEELGLTLPILLDTDLGVSDQYRLVGLPNNFFIDSDGVLQSFQLGFLVEEQMRESLAEAGVS